MDQKKARPSSHESMTFIHMLDAPASISSTLKSSFQLVICVGLWVQGLGFGGSLGFRLVPVGHLCRVYGLGLRIW